MAFTSEPLTGACNPTPPLDSRLLILIALILMTRALMSNSVIPLRSRSFHATLQINKVVGPGKPSLRASLTGQRAQ